MIIHAEAGRLKNVISRDDYVIVLCIEGRKTSTEELKSRIERVKQQGYGTVTFVIGDPLT